MTDVGNYNLDEDGDYDSDKDVFGSVDDAGDTDHDSGYNESEHMTTITTISEANTNNEITIMAMLIENDIMAVDGYCNTYTVFR